MEPCNCDQATDYLDALEYIVNECLVRGDEDDMNTAMNQITAVAKETIDKWGVKL